MDSPGEAGKTLHIYLGRDPLASNSSIEVLQFWGSRRFANILEGFLVFLLVIDGSSFCWFSYVSFFFLFLLFFLFIFIEKSKHAKNILTF
jgi:hypothetical protein